MLSRALIPATVMLLIGVFAAIPVRAENLEAGKSPSQIFTGTCSACHKGMRGLVKTVAPGSLAGFLRQHYTTSSEMAGQLSAYLLSNGAVDPRVGAIPVRPGRDAKPEAKSDARSEPRPEPKPAAAPAQPEPRLGHRRRAPPQEAEKTDVDGPTPPGPHRREPKSESRNEPKSDPKGEAKGEPAERPQRRNIRRLAKPAPDAPEADRPAAEGSTRAGAAGEVGPAGRERHKLSKRSKSRREEPAKDEPGSTDSIRNGADRTGPGLDEGPGGEAAKVETRIDEAVKASTSGARLGEGARPEATKGEARGSETTLRVDPVPAVTPAHKPVESDAGPSQTATPSSGATASFLPSYGGHAEPSAAAPSLETPAQPPAGPPTPPISQ